MTKDFQKILLIIVALVSTGLYIFKGPMQYKGKLEETTIEATTFKSQLDSILVLKQQIEADYQKMTNERDSLGAELFESQYYVVNLEKENKRLKGNKKTEVLYTTGVDQIMKLKQTVAKLESQKDSLHLGIGAVKRKAAELEVQKLNAEDEVRQLRGLLSRLDQKPLQAQLKDEWVNIQVTEVEDSVDIDVEMKNQVSLDYVKIKYGFLNLRKRHAIYISTDNPYISEQVPKTYVLDKKLQRKIKSEQ